MVPTSYSYKPSPKLCALRGVFLECFIFTCHHFAPTGKLWYFVLEMLRKLDFHKKEGCQIIIVDELGSSAQTRKLSAGASFEMVSLISNCVSKGGFLRPSVSD